MIVQPNLRYLSWRQLASLIIANKLSMLTTYAPILTGAPATRDAWISAWLASGAALLITLVSYYLLKRFPGQSLFVINRKVLGPWIGRALNLTYAVMFLYLGAIALRMFSEVLAEALLPETPTFVISLLMMLLVITGVMGGMEVLGRLADLLAPLLVVTILFLALLAWPLIHLDRLLPVFEFGVGPMLQQTLTPIGIFGEAAWTVMLVMPFLRDPHTALKAIGLASLVNGLMVSIGAAILIATMGPHLIDKELFPMLTAIRMIRIAEFLTRLEWTLSILWTGAMYAKIGLLLWGAARSMRDGLGLDFKRRKPMIVVLASVITVGSH